ncbi:MAG: DUF58 domain-containing protein [Pirellula sp.]
MTDRTTPSSWVDMETLMAIQDLQWRARTVVDGLNNGMHRSPLHGFSVEFSEYRPFSEGDDPRSIDWKLYARSDRYYIKKFEDETNRRCYLVVDQSKSMEYRSIAYSKLDYARTLAATLAFHLSQQRDAVGMVTFDSEIADVLTARFRTGQLKRLLSLLERKPSGDRTDLRGPLSQVAELVRQRSLMIVISDFLVPPEELRVPLGYLAARKHEVVLLRILDPNEIDFNGSRPVMIRDVESGAEKFVDPQSIAGSYRRRFSEHESILRGVVEPLGIAYHVMRTDTPLDASLVEFLGNRNRGAAMSGSNSARSSGNTAKTTIGAASP